MLLRSLVFVAASTIALPALAKDLHVAPGGNDAAAGDKGAPWKTIGKAARSAVAGDTVHVASGTYEEVITSNADGTAAAPIVFKSDEKWGAKIVGPPHVTSGPVSVWTANGDYVDIIGFDITGGPRVGILINASFVRAIGNHVHDMKADWGGGNGGAGIDSGNYDAHDDDMIGNVVHDIGPPGPSNGIHGLYHSNLRGKIVNNIAYRNSGWGIHTWHNPKDVLIANNLVFENRSGGIIVGAGDSPGTGVADGFLVVNNIVVNNYARAGIIEYGAYGPGNRYVNNLVRGNAAGAFGVSPMTKISGTITDDPLFVKYDGMGNSGDYHLLPGSAAIDKGSATMAPVDDIEGVPRPQGSAHDIGPYEWRAAPVIDAGVPDAPIAADTGTAVDASTIADSSVEEPKAEETDSGACGCAVPGSSGGSGELGLLALLLLARRRGHRPC